MPTLGRRRGSQWHRSRASSIVSSLVSIVGQVEGLAARRAAEFDLRTRTPLVRTVRKFNADVLHAAEAQPPNSSVIFDLDVDFHRSYVEVSSGPRLLALHNAIKPQADRYKRLYTTLLVNEIHRSVDEPESIIQSIAEDMPDEADQAAELTSGMRPNV